MAENFVPPTVGELSVHNAANQDLGAKMAPCTAASIAMEQEAHSTGPTRGRGRMSKSEPNPKFGKGWQGSRRRRQGKGEPSGPKTSANQADRRTQSVAVPLRTASLLFELQKKLGQVEWKSRSPILLATSHERKMTILTGPI